MYDIIIIGAGVTGCAVARFLSRYKAKVCVVERCEDVCCGTSKANSAIVHAGFDAEHGTLMAKMNLQGNLMMPQLAKDLDFAFIQNGSLVVCMSEEDLPRLQKLYENGVANGVQQLEIVDSRRLHELEPNVAAEAVAALWAPTGGIVCPFGYTIALAENAYANGVEFRFDTEVKGLSRNENGWAVQTDKGVLDTRYVVNAAGLYSDVFHNMVSAKKIHITPRRGDYFLLDKTTGGFVKHTIFPQPTKLGKGILVAPTIHGNTLVGPTAIDIEDKEAVATTQEGFDEILKKSSMYVTNAPVRQVITSFAGLRAHEDNHEFILGEPEDAPFFFDCAGIESPGLTSSPAIGEYMGEMISSKFGFEKKENWIAGRKDVLKPSELSLEERNELIKKEPAYGRIICRCESITEGEILDAIHRPLGARSLDGVKRRTRAGMGRCQAGFCSPRVMEILQRELNIPLEEVRKNDAGSYLVLEKTKGGKA